MSERAKTIGELLDNVCRELCDMNFWPQVEDGETPGIISSVLEHVRGYHIIPGADVVVTKEGLEAVARRMHAEFSAALVICWDETPEKERQQWCGVARRTLEAAGIVVADKVMEAELGFQAGTDEDERVPVWVNPGDTVYIYRVDKEK